MDIIEMIDTLNANNKVGEVLINADSNYKWNS